MSELPSEPLWCPKCGGREWTRVPGGEIGLSDLEVTCDACGERYFFAVNIGAQLEGAEQEQRERESARSTEGQGEDKGA